MQEDPNLLGLRWLYLVHFFSLFFFCLRDSEETSYVYKQIPVARAFL